MHKLPPALVAMFLVVFSLSATAALPDESVNGYTRKDGTYVGSHHRSNPNGNPYKNYSFPATRIPTPGNAPPGMWTPACAIATTMGLGSGPAITLSASTVTATEREPPLP